MSNILQKQVNYLQQLKHQRSAWSKFSFVFISIIFVLCYFWKDILHANNPMIWYSIALLILPVTMTWWYWTMQMVVSLLAYRMEEVIILKEIVLDLQEVKKDIQELKK